MRTEEQKLLEILKTLSPLQLEFVAARLVTQSDKDAALQIGISPDSVYNWPNKADINEAVRLAKIDSVNVAREKLRRLACEAVDAVAKEMRGTRNRLPAALAILDRVGLIVINRHELTGARGGPIRTESDVHIDFSKLSDSQLDSLIDIADSLGLGRDSTGESKA